MDTNSNVSCIEKLLTMDSDEQRKWLTNILESIKEKHLESEFLAAVENVFDDVTKNNVKNWLELHRN